MILQRCELGGGEEHIDSSLLIGCLEFTEELSSVRVLSYLSDASFDVLGFLYCLSTNDSPGLAIIEMLSPRY